MLGGSAIGLVQRDILLHSRRRTSVRGVIVLGRKVRLRHGASMILLVRHVVGLVRRVGVHVLSPMAVHGGVDMMLVLLVLVTMSRPILVTISTARRRRTSSHVGASLHLLPSRQMRAIVHHAGLGWELWRQLLTEVRATAADWAYTRWEPR